MAHRARRLLGTRHDLCHGGRWRQEPGPRNFLRQARLVTKIAHGLENSNHSTVAANLACLIRRRLQDKITVDSKMRGDDPTSTLLLSALCGQFPAASTRGRTEPKRSIRRFFFSSSSLSIGRPNRSARRLRASSCSGCTVSVRSKRFAHIPLNPPSWAPWALAQCPPERARACRS